MRQKILAKLYELRGAYISGNDLAKALGVSRVAVWKHIEALKQEGYDITGISGKGYSLKDEGSIIIPPEVMRNMPDSNLFKQILFYPTVNSTNETAKTLVADKKGEEGIVIVARKQTAGKGRLGRRWESGVGGLWFSLILRPRLPLRELPLLSLVFAVAVAKALDQFLVTPSQIKWPNDVLVKGKKIGGILLEGSGQVDNVENVIVGIGININQESWADDIGKIATSLKQETKEEVSNNVILPVVLSSLESYYNLFINEGFAAIREEFKEKCLHLGQSVSVQQMNQAVTGINTDIDIQGSMLLKVNDDIIHVTTGDVKII